MVENKRYYWLKLKEDFFSEVRMKRLRKLSAGGTYTIIYLKLLLLSLREEGKLYFECVDETFSKELALILDESEDDIAITLNYLSKVGLLQEVREGEYFLTELPSLIGSETAWAERKRNYRIQQREQKSRTLSSSCPTDVRQEIEIELEKELEKERELEKTPLSPSLPQSKPYGIFENVVLSNAEYQQIQDLMQKNAAVMIDKLSRYMKSTGKSYQSHFATLLNWYEQDREKLGQKKTGSYSLSDYEDSNSL
jgi:phage replisome organizer N-terminal domain protein